MAKRRRKKTRRRRTRKRKGYSKRWIQGATKNRGGLHRSLGIPSGKRIPLSRIRSAAKRKGKVGRQARLALTLRKVRRRRK